MKRKAPAKKPAANRKAAATKKAVLKAPKASKSAAKATAKPAARPKATVGAKKTASPAKPRPPAVKAPRVAARKATPTLTPTATDAAAAPPPPAPFEPFDVNLYERADVDAYQRIVGGGPVNGKGNTQPYVHPRSLREGSVLPSGAPLVLWLAGEATPWAHTGGLGDVIGSLPAVLRARGWDVRLCLPLYADARRRPIGPPIMKLDIPLGHGQRRVPVAIREAIDPPAGVPTYLVESELFDRPGIYGSEGRAYPDNPLRFGVWQLAARELAATLEPAPALIHCHDWHAALIPALTKMPGQWVSSRRDVRTIFTIHNLEFQGHTPKSIMDELGLPRTFWHPQWLEHFGGVNFLKGAILSADRVTTVSRNYADEIRTPGLGMGLDGPLRDRGDDLTGIVNGIDTIAWDPATDPQIPARFDAEHRAPRAQCKAALRQELGLGGTPDEPLLGYIGRLTESKGVDLLIRALPPLLALGAKAMVLGSGDPSLEAALQDIERAYPDQFRAILRFDAALARRAYAGVDLMIVPSRNEPCGLVQLYSLRYGAVPVAHAVGGLRDTVRDGVTGFTFEETTPRAVAAAVRRALDTRAEPERWDRIVAAGMSQDWSWVQSAAGYDALYRETLQRPPRVRPLPPPEDDQAIFSDFGPDLPPAQGCEQLRLMVQGPICIYAYWESVGPEPLDLILEEQPSGYAFMLAEQVTPIGEFWIPTMPEHAYRALLCRRDGTVVRVSNIVITPRDRPVAPGEATPVWLERLLASGSTDDDATADRWTAIFPAEPVQLRGTRYWDGPIPGGRESGGVTDGQAASSSGRVRS